MHSQRRKDKAAFDQDQSFFDLACGAMTRISSRITSLWSNNDVIHDDIRVTAPQMVSQKTTILILCSFVFSPMGMHSLFSRLKPPKFWLFVMWREIWISSISYIPTPFHAIEVGFSPEIIEFSRNLFISWIFSDAKFGYHIWRQNGTHMGWNKYQ